MDEFRAFIFYDHGISDRIDTVAPPILLKVRVEFKQARPDGMPTSEELPNLTVLENDLQALVQRHQSLYVGRVTVDGHRHFYIYTPDSEQTWSARLDRLGASHGYAVALAFRPDESHEGYWKELFPTEDDWQVIKDIRVIEALRKKGDDGKSSRQIEHWAYFPSHDTAERFSQWARERGYNVVGSDAANGGQICVRFSHEGTVQLTDITSNTIRLRRKASEIGGEYDGWETPVCRASG